MTAAPANPLTEPGAPDAPVGGDAVIDCRGLTKLFRDFWFRNRVRAVDHIDLTIRHREVFGLLGPNGSGKSTTIKMILGLLRPTAGSVSVFGKSPDDVATKARIGYLPEESYLYRFLNARETLDYYGRLFHLPRDQRRKRTEMLLEMVGLEAVAHRPVGEYSKGMQRRIGLAQALINDPQLLILDEPTSGLDPIGTSQIKKLIIELARRGKTVLLCSHLLADVEDVCDRVAVMFGGKVRTVGTIAQLLTRQDTTTVHTAPLSPEIIKELEDFLAARGKAIQKVEQPRRKLESLFLEIVDQAKAEGVATSGATSGGKLADFLVTEAGLTDEKESARVIDELIHTEPVAPAEPPPPPPPVARKPQPTPTPPPAAEPPAPPAPPARKPAPPPEPPPPAVVPVPAARAPQPTPPPESAAPTASEQGIIDQLINSNWAAASEREAPATVSDDSPPPASPAPSQLPPPVAASSGDDTEVKATDDELNLVEDLVQGGWSTSEDPQKNSAAAKPPSPKRPTSPPQTPQPRPPSDKSAAPRPSPPPAKPPPPAPPTASTTDEKPFSVFNIAIEDASSTGSEQPDAADQSASSKPPDPPPPPRSPAP